MKKICFITNGLGDGGSTSQVTLAANGPSQKLAEGKRGFYAVNAE